MKSRVEIPKCLIYSLLCSTCRIEDNFRISSVLQSNLGIFLNALTFIRKHFDLLYYNFDYNNLGKLEAKTTQGNSWLMNEVNWGIICMGIIPWIGAWARLQSCGVHGLKAASEEGMCFKCSWYLIQNILNESEVHITDEVSSLIIWI